MAHVNDAKLATFELNLLKTGHINDLEVEALQLLHPSVTSDVIDEAWHQYWDSQLVAAGQFNDRAFAWLGSLGHTDSLSDRWLEFWAPTI